MCLYILMTYYMQDDKALIVIFIHIGCTSAACTPHMECCWPGCYTCTVIHLIDWRWWEPGDHERNGRTNWLEEHVGTNVMVTTKTKTRH